jgi:hypothetical protein
LSKRRTPSRDDELREKQHAAPFAAYTRTNDFAPTIDGEQLTTGVEGTASRTDKDIKYKNMRRREMINGLGTELGVHGIVHNRHEQNGAERHGNSFEMRRLVDAELLGRSQITNSFQFT